jgi:hypothetical protein
VVINCLIGDNFLEIHRRLRENGLIGGEIIKVMEVTDIPEQPKILISGIVPLYVARILWIT